jgi:hypothetical protein
MLGNSHPIYTPSLVLGAILVFYGGGMGTSTLQLKILGCFTLGTQQDIVYEGIMDSNMKDLKQTNDHALG